MIKNRIKTLKKIKLKFAEENFSADSGGIVHNKISGGWEFTAMIEFPGLFSLGEDFSGE